MQVASIWTFGEQKIALSSLTHAYLVDKRQLSQSSITPGPKLLSYSNVCILSQSCMSESALTCL